MLKSIAQVISIVFQPLLMPGLAIFLLFSVHNYFSVIYVPEFVNRLYLIGFILTVLLPIISFLILYRWGIISDLQLSKRKERVMPTYVAIIYYGCFYYILREIPGLSTLILSSFFGGIIAILIANIITTYWKISIHAIGISLVTGIMVITSELTFTDHLFLISALFILIGLVVWSRLYLNRHTPAQVLAGSILGFTLPYLFGLCEFWV